MRRKLNKELSEIIGSPIINIKKYNKCSNNKKATNKNIVDYSNLLTSTKSIIYVYK